MVERQIFYDPSGRRRKRFRLAVVLFVLLNMLTVAALFATIRVVPAETSAASGARAWDAAAHAQIEPPRPNQQAGEPRDQAFAGDPAAERTKGRRAESGGGRDGV